MPNTELFMLTREELANTIKSMKTERLIAELDDTIQFDMLKMSNEQWITYKDKKVYLAIISELSKRL
jgi:hypothetical protein